MSAVITDCWYGVYRIGDQQIVPDRIQMLADSLQSSLGSQLSGKTISIKRFEIFNSSQAVSHPNKDTGSSNPAAVGVRGSAGGWAVSSIVMSVIQANTCEAKLSPEKNPNNYPAIVVDVEMTVNGVPIVGNMVQIEPIGKEASLTNGDLTRERVRRALSATVTKVQEEVAKVVSK